MIFGIGHASGKTPGPADAGRAGLERPYAASDGVLSLIAFNSKSRDSDPRLIKKTERAARLLLQKRVMVPNFPKHGHRYLDFYRTFDENHDVRSAVVDCLNERYSDFGVNAIAAIGNGGFTLGACVAHALKLPLFPIRKASDTVYNSYITSVGMVYANRQLTLSKDIEAAGKNVVLVDDTIATGGSFKGGLDLLHQAGALVIEIAAVFETASKGGRELVAPTNVFSIVARDQF